MEKFREMFLGKDKIYQTIKDRLQLDQKIKLSSPIG